MKKIFTTFVLIFRAIINISGKNIIEMSGYMAYSILLAFFPFLMFLVSLSSFLVSPQIIQQFLGEINELVPHAVAATLNPVVEQVLESTSTSLLTFSILTALIISSSGVEALRSGLNDIFKLHETRGFLFRRIQDILFVILGSLAFLLASLSIIIMPVFIHYYRELTFHFMTLSGIHISILRYIITFFALTGFGALFYSILPNHRRSFKECLPGAYVAAGVWIVAASLFSFYLNTFNRYNLIYGSLAGVIITLLFFQLTAIMLLLGAQYNMERQKESQHD